jgi:hypothetical protein
MAARIPLSRPFHRYIAAIEIHPELTRATAWTLRRWIETPAKGVGNREKRSESFSIPTRRVSFDVPLNGYKSPLQLQKTNTMR